MRVGISFVSFDEEAKGLKNYCRSGGIGRRAGFRVQWGKLRPGSNPGFGTMNMKTRRWLTFAGFYFLRLFFLKSYRFFFIRSFISAASFCFPASCARLMASSQVLTASSRSLPQSASERQERESVPGEDLVISAVSKVSVISRPAFSASSGFTKIFFCPKGSTMNPA